MGKTRRRVLYGLGLAGAGGGGYVLANDDVNLGDVGVPNNVAGPPATENKIGEVTDFDTPLGGIPLKRLEFFESGAAIIYPEAERGECHERLALLHESNSLGQKNDGDGSVSVDDSDALRTWGYGNFDENITIDMRGAISQKQGYPDRIFKLRSYPESGVCLLASSSKTFEVPESYMPSGSQ